MPDFTKGKWEVVYRYNGIDDVVCNTYSVAIGIRREADSRLIAAAPDMYEL